MQVVRVFINRDDLSTDELVRLVKLGLSHLDEDVEAYVEPDEDGEPEDTAGDEAGDDACPTCGQPLPSADEPEDDETTEDDYLAAFTGTEEDDG